ncbi:MAG: 3-dehydroquinate dehydratase [SAR324 cluster bacterium]|nr:3-dehydroquinate dehydratase [SAR324 cluster bacterium]MCZ6533415.1 3-dehydroquinate dehydratase [SAR324 cluster bacterium]MCZ6645616.1 3-dehydroquinate dehydratase [SAR324 cluster bacterium]
MTSILLIQGANMAYLGKREPELYGTTSAAELDNLLMAHAADKGYALDIFYTHLEGEAIGRIYEAAEQGVDGLVMNPAGFVYAGHALRDCVKAAKLPYVEVHMTNIDARGMRSALADVAVGMITGLGVQSYLLGLEAMLHLLEEKK